jgi:hypothetical protein
VLRPARELLPWWIQAEPARSLGNVEALSLVGRLSRPEPSSESARNISSSSSFGSRCCVVLTTASLPPAKKSWDAISVSGSLGSTNSKLSAVPLPASRDTGSPAHQGSAPPRRALDRLPSDQPPGLYRQKDPQQGQTSAGAKQVVLLIQVKSRVSAIAGGSAAIWSSAPPGRHRVPASQQARGRLPHG